jgi:predicted transposase/invertase (TIGR01784 family)
MLGTHSLKETRVYKDAFAEGREKGLKEGREEIQHKAVAELLKLGLDAEQIAQGLSLTLATAKK